MPYRKESYTYGDDIDGNRGVRVTEIEITSDFSDDEADYRIDGSLYSREEAINTFLTKLDLKDASKAIKVFGEPIIQENRKSGSEAPKKTLELWGHDNDKEEYKDHYFLEKNNKDEVSLMMYTGNDISEVESVDESEFYFDENDNLVHTDDITEYLEEELDAENVEDIDFEQEAADDYADYLYDQYKDSQL